MEYGRGIGSINTGGYMKFKLSEGGLSTDYEVEAMKRLMRRMEVITEAIELFNQSDWKLEEVAMWLQYEKDLALVESSLYSKEQERQ